MRMDIELEGAIEAQARMRGVNEQIRPEIQAAVLRAANAAAQIWRSNIPYRSGELYRSIEVDSDPTWRPGGAGGGGNWEARVSVGGQGEQTEHLKYVVEGTGLFGPQRQLIYRPGGGPMKFMNDRGETIFTQWTRGQMERDRWVEMGQEAADLTISQAIRELDLLR